MTKKIGIRIGIVAVIAFVMCFSDCSFAEELEGLDVLGYSLNYVVSVLGWLWVFFAKLAGTFLTNTWVYGEILGLDTLMWKYWNVMKNIANFGLGFYFVYVIFKGLIKGGEEITQKLKGIILWLLAAGIGIQVSWFFVAAVIDVSTITLAAAGAFPSQVISESPYIGGSLKLSMSEYLSDSQDYVENGQKISLFPKDQKSLLQTERIQLKASESFTGLVDSFMPSADSVSGPLYYIGFSILKTNVVTSIDTSSKNGIKATILNTVIQGGTTVVFAIEMLVLCILALMRIVYLWMFIIMSPIAILLWCIKESGQKFEDGDKSFLSKFMKQINFTSFFINVFKPTIIVLGFGLAVLFVSLMKTVVVDDSKGISLDIEGTKITSMANGATTNGNVGDQTYTTTIDNNIIQFTLASAGKTFLQIILSILTVLIVYFIIRFAVKFGEGKDFVSEKIGKVQDEVGKMMGQIPVIPVAGYDKQGNPTTRYINSGQVFGLGGKDSIVREKVRWYQGKVNETYDKQNEIINSWFGNQTGHLSKSEKDAITAKMRLGDKANLWRNLQEASNHIKTMKDDNGRGMTLNLQTASNEGWWMKRFKEWLDAAAASSVQIQDLDWQRMVDERKKESDPTKRSLETLFSNHKYVEAYAKMFDLGLSTNENNWEHLKNADISKK